MKAPVARTAPCPADCDCTADCERLSASTTDGKGRLDAEAGGWRPSKEAVAQAIRDNLHIMAASMTGETGVLSETSIYKATAAILRLPQGEPQPKDTK